MLRVKVAQKIVAETFDADVELEICASRNGFLQIAAKQLETKAEVDCVEKAAKEKISQVEAMSRELRELDAQIESLQREREIVREKLSASETSLRTLEISKRNSLLGNADLLHTLKEEEARLLSLEVSGCTYPRVLDQMGPLDGKPIRRVIMRRLFGPGILHEPLDYNDLSFALIDSTRRGLETTTRILLEEGACINLVYGNGQTPLLAAINSTQFDILLFLLANGADVEQKDGDGLSPLFKAIQIGQADIVRLLLRSGADIR